jgi:uncharacterized membrane protein YgcG
MSTPSVQKLLPAAIALCMAALWLVAAADGAMRSKQLETGLCQTTGGGRFVKLKQFPGEKIDRRLVRDVRFLARRYKAFITDGYSTDPVHSANGEHPIGLAVDIVPDTSRGGTWRDIDRLADWAEPKQNQPRAPFRWVGYDGDAGHGSGHHLHLSWSHSETAYNKPARTVYSVYCPTKKPKTDDGSGTDAPDTDGGIGGTSDGDGKRDGDGKKGDGKKGDGKRDGGSTGGISPDGSGSTSGGVSARSYERMSRRADYSTSVETGGVDG